MYIYITCQSAIQYHHDMIDNHFLKYTLLSKLSTNPLEREFSRIRAGTGGVRTITIRNVMQKTRILTAKKFLESDAQEAMKMLENVSPSHKCQKCSFSIDHHEDLSLEYASLLEKWSEIKKDAEQKPFFEIVNFIAGYVQKRDDHTDIGAKQKKLNKITANTSFLNEISKGYLITPCCEMADFVAIACWVFEDLYLYKHTCQKSCIDIFKKILIDFEIETIPNEFKGQDSQIRRLANTLHGHFARIKSVHRTKVQNSKLQDYKAETTKQKIN